jgi:hypothetical protein
MSTFIIVSQCIIALGIYNVWLLRMNRATAWRGGDAMNMEQEFHTYGLSPRFMHFIRVCKLTMATSLIVGIWYPPLTVFGALIMAALMSAAVAMHIKVRDPLRKSLPAASLLVLSLLVAFGTQAS